MPWGINIRILLTLLEISNIFGPCNITNNIYINKFLYLLSLPNIFYFLLMVVLSLYYVVRHKLSS